MSSEIEQHANVFLRLMIGNGRAEGECFGDGGVKVRYLEVEVGSGATARRVLLPATFAKIQANAVQVRSIFGHHFADVPGLRHPDQVTRLEEDKICAYYGGGTLYASAARSEPLL